jgi:hypothetical protein
MPPPDEETIDPLLKPKAHNLTLTGESSLSLVVR